jgi:hypothetical protein
MNRYEEPALASREDLESALATGDPPAISRTMLGVLQDDDVDWLTRTLLDLTEHESIDVRATAITSLGHVARIHGHIDRGRVLPRLRDLGSDPLLRGRVDDTSMTSSTSQGRVNEKGIDTEVEIPLEGNPLP